VLLLLVVVESTRHRAKEEVTFDRNVMFGNVKLYGGISITVTADGGPPDVVGAVVDVAVGLLLLLAKRDDDVDPKPPPPPPNNNEEEPSAVDDEDEEAPVVGAGAETPKENAIDGLAAPYPLCSTNYYVNRYRTKRAMLPRICNHR
jgi:hypothetical protein